MEKIINLIMEKFYLTYEKGNFQEIKYGALNKETKLNNNEYKIKKLNVNNKNITFGISNNFSFTYFGIYKKENKEENLIHDKIEEKKNTNEDLFKYRN